jgi:IclR family pca regulon transcriptional regulator
MSTPRSSAAPFGRELQAEPRPSSEYVQSFARGLAVIRAFGPGAKTMTLTEVAQKTGLTRAGARRILLTLQTLGYVALDGRSFSLTPRVLDLGYSYLSSMPLWDVAQPIMEDLVDRVHESVSASVLDGDEIVYVLRVPTHRIMTIGLSIGSRLPAYCTSMGRVLLGALSEEALDRALVGAKLVAQTRHTVTDAKQLRKIIQADAKRGWSLVDQELEEGLRSISVPLRDSGGHVIAAMNISGQAARCTVADMQRNFLTELQAAAARIEQALRLRGR